MTALSARVSILILSSCIISVFFLFVWTNAYATSNCPAGTRPATSADIATMIAAGTPNAQVGQCWNTSDPNIGSLAGSAKAYLMQHATGDANISCLNAQFAEKLMKLMQSAPGGPPTITSGYRGEAVQTAAKASGASQVGWCDGYHNYGLAADFNNASKETKLWLRTNAPSFGLTRLPAMNISDGCSSRGSGFCDPAHIQIEGPHPGRDQCGICDTSHGGGGALPTNASSNNSSSSAYPEDIEPPGPRSSTPPQQPARDTIQNNPTAPPSPPNNLAQNPVASLTPLAPISPSASVFKPLSGGSITPATFVNDLFQATSTGASTTRETLASLIRGDLYEISTHATNTQNVRLNDDAQSMSGVTYARPTSSFFASSTIDTIAHSSSPRVSDTFTSRDFATNTNERTTYGADNSFVSATFHILNQLKVQLLGILDFLHGQ